MKKYKLLKDLPWMKAGSVFWFDTTGFIRDEHRIYMAECYEATKNYFFSTENGNYFEDSDWIVEVKDEPITNSPKEK